MIKGNTATPRLSLVEDCCLESYLAMGGHEMADSLMDILKGYIALGSFLVASRVSDQAMSSGSQIRVYGVLMRAATAYRGEKLERDEQSIPALSAEEGHEILSDLEMVSALSDVLAEIRGMHEILQKRLRDRHYIDEINEVHLVGPMMRARRDYERGLLG